MAYLQPPLTIINNKPEASTVSYSIGRTHQFLPPAATWFDEEHQHFVALEARSANEAEHFSAGSSFVSGVGSLESSFISGINNVRKALGDDEDEDDEEDDAISEVVRYQAFGIPDKGYNQQLSIRDFGVSEISTIDAVTSKIQTGGNHLVTEISVAFSLPKQLANVETRLDANDDDTYGTERILLSRRIPTLAKFSPKVNGLRYLALQYTPTMVRVIPVERPSTGVKGVGEDYAKFDNKHWTIDLDHDTNPVSTSPDRLPHFRDSISNRTLFAKSVSRDCVIPGDTTIIGGGVLWCNRGDSLELIIVASTAVIVYNLNTTHKPGATQITKTLVFPHVPASSFYYEPISRTLVIGSYKSNDTDKAETLHREISDTSGSLQETKYKFPRAIMEMKTLFFPLDAPVGILPTFAVGTLREILVDQGKKNSSTEGSADDDNMHVVLPTDISVVNLYGSVYCVEVGSLGSGRGIGLTELDMERGAIRVRQHNTKMLKGPTATSESQIGLIDNLLFIFSKEEKSTLFIDVADIFSDDKRVHRESIDVGDSGQSKNNPSIYDESLSFLAPSFFLNTNGQGLLYQANLDMDHLLDYCPSTSCIIPMILRRGERKEKLISHVVERFSHLIELRDTMNLQNWIGVIVDMYSKSSDAIEWDFDSTACLVPKATLAVFDELPVVNDLPVKVPAFCSQILTQFELLHCIFLPQAIAAINEGDAEKLRLISSLSVHYLVEMERKMVLPSVALQSFIIAILCRTEQDEVLSSFLSARQTQWTIMRRRKHMNLPTVHRMYFDSPGAVSFAEALFLIASSHRSGKDSMYFNDHMRQKLISHGTMILLGCGYFTHAAKMLLEAGEYNIAIAICSKAIAKRIRTNKGLEEVTCGEGTKAQDFFHAAVERTRRMPRKYISASIAIFL
mmetsp:Transcript_30246/g.60455  ORF Transcript_30246/g.60455 Transcript_30246/m.60455 type:complete len:906 (-) Transcript_30246:1857-4574(-)